MLQIPIFHLFRCNAPPGVEGPPEALFSTDSIRKVYLAAVISLPVGLLVGRGATLWTERLNWGPLWGYRGVLLLPWRPLWLKRSRRDRSRVQIVTPLPRHAASPHARLSSLRPPPALQPLVYRATTLLVAPISFASTSRRCSASPHSTALTIRRRLLRHPRPEPRLPRAALT